MHDVWRACACAMTCAVCGSALPPPLQNHMRKTPTQTCSILREGPVPPTIAVQEHLLAPPQGGEHLGELIHRFLHGDSAPQHAVDVQAAPTRP